MKNKKAKIFLALFLVLFLFSLILLARFLSSQEKIKKIKTFEDCARAGYPVTTSYPAICHTPDGRSFTQELTPEEKEKLKPPEERPLCTTDSDCQKGFSCWYKLPVGATEGEKGSKENPGRCWDNEAINTML